MKQMVKLPKHKTDQIETILFDKIVILLIKFNRNLNLPNVLYIFI